MGDEGAVNNTTNKEAGMKRRRFLIVTVGVIVLSAGLILMSVNRGAQAAPPASNPGNPFQAILDKLDHVLAAITGLGGGAGNHTLRWDTNNPSATRFTTAFTGAVLDNNTGLVWEQAPTSPTASWFNARSECLDKNVGGTKGWRLPSIVELVSVFDPSLPAPFVPASIFTGIQVNDAYWSATTKAEFPTVAWTVNFNTGLVSGIFKEADGSILTWCVRGGMNADTY
jgi:hypothetical protein